MRLVTFVSPDYLDVLAEYGASHLQLPHGWYYMVEGMPPVGPYPDGFTALEQGKKAADHEKERRAALEADRQARIAELVNYVSLPLPLGR